jgi:hypothetical protein
MVRSWKFFRDFEEKLIGTTPVDHFANLKIADELFRQAKSLGIFPLKNPLEGIEVDIERSRVFNSVRRASQADRDGA